MEVKATPNLASIDDGLDSIIQQSIDRHMQSASSEAVRQISDTMEPILKDAFRSCFINVLIPAFENACQEMVRQMRTGGGASGGDYQVAGQMQMQAEQMRAMAQRVDTLTNAMTDMQTTISSMAQNLSSASNPPAPESTGQSVEPSARKRPAK